MSEKNEGPIYNTPLLESLRLGTGMMRQALPSRNDLKGVKNERVVAGYEILLQHYYDAIAERDRLKAEVEKLWQAIAEEANDWPSYERYCLERVVEDSQSRLSGKVTSNEKTCPS